MSNTHDCSAEDLETNALGAGRRVAMCVIHLIAGVAVALIAAALLAVFAQAY